MTIGTELDCLMRHSLLQCLLSSLVGYVVHHIPLRGCIWLLWRSLVFGLTVRRIL